MTVHGRGIRRTVQFKGRIAYAAVYEGPDEGRATPGWYLAVAEEDEPGYYQTTWDPFRDEASARAAACDLNERLGLDERAAFLLIATTMRGDGRRGPRPGSRRVA